MSIEKKALQETIEHTFGTETPEKFQKLFKDALESKCLKLQYSHFMDRHKTIEISSDDITNYIIPFLVKNVSVNSFDFAKAEFFGLQSELIAQFIKRNTTVTSLILSNITFAYTQPIFDALKENTIITTLSFSGTELSPALACMIADLLKVNKNLKFLNLSNTYLRAENLITILNSVNVSALTSLNLSNNGLVTTAADSISSFISMNTTIQSLDLSEQYTFITREDRRKVLNALKANKTLSLINLTSGRETAEQTTQLTTYIHALLTHPKRVCNQQPTVSPNINSGVISTRSTWESTLMTLLDELATEDSIKADYAGNFSLTYDKRKDNEQQLLEMLKTLQCQPFGYSTSEFLNNLSIYLQSENCKFIASDMQSSMKFWTLIEQYIIANKISDSKLAKDRFSVIQQQVEKIKNDSMDPRGIKLLPMYLSQTLMRNIYLSQSQALVELFFNNLSRPHKNIFGEGDAIPDFLDNYYKTSITMINRFLKEHSENDVIKAQRVFREHRRQKEEVARITALYFPQDTHGLYKAKKLMKRANMLYYPCCEPRLMARIIKASEDIQPFSVIRHLTSSKGLTSILDDALYGRRTLLHHYLKFQPAALAACDLTVGDANAICFGLDNGGIDPQIIQKEKEHTIQIVLDLNKIAQDNPHAFYKQRDFGYTTRNIRSVSLGNKKLFFTHTSSSEWGLEGTSGDLNSTYFQLTSSTGVPYATSSLPKPSFIGYNTKNMHQILALNFFRFIDTLTDCNKMPATAIIKTLYDDISRLSKTELVNFLDNLRVNLTDTAEFNFYGAHKIDFSSIISITAYNPLACHSYVLHISEFIKKLNDGNMATLEEACSKIPTLFQSHRFIDYVLANVKVMPLTVLVQKELERLRSLCSQPQIQFMPKQFVATPSTKKTPPPPPKNSVAGSTVLELIAEMENGVTGMQDNNGPDKYLAENATIVIEQAAQHKQFASPRDMSDIEDALNALQTKYPKGNTFYSEIFQRVKRCKEAFGLKSTAENSPKRT